MIVFIVSIIMLFSLFSFAYTSNSGSVLPTVYFLVYLSGVDVSYGENIVGINCLPEDLYSKNVSVEGQTDINPAFIITKSGSLPATELITWLSVNTPTGFDFKCDIDNTPAGAIILNITNQTLYSGTINHSDEIDVFCWCDFDNPQDYVESDIYFDMI